MHGHSARICNFYCVGALC